MKNIFFLIASIVLLLNTLSLNAQISASETEGCAPLASVIFMSNFPNPTNISWDFDDGASSNLQTPIHSFANPGIYTVTYTATSGGNTVNASLIITVHANPDVNFITVPENGVCLGESIEFISTSIGGSDSEITSLQWDFDDGTPGETGDTIIHTYVNPGTYSVTLIAVDGNGCTSSSTQEDIITVSIPPNIDITTNPSPVIACEAPLNVTFTNNTTSNSPLGTELTHNWDFGNGQISTDEVPTGVTYATEGIYTITYDVTDDAGCTATHTIPVSVQEPTAQINVLGLTNGISCKNVQLEVIGTQGGVFNYGDGSSGTQTSHNYSSEGVFDITYSISVSGCPAVATAQVNVEIPSAQIFSDPGYACYKPADFSYSVATDYDIDTYAWSFPYGATSTDASPTNQLDYPGPNEYDRNNLQVFTTSLNFTTVNGCTGSASIIDSLALPNALFYPSTTQGCAPISTQFNDESSFYLPFGEIVEWEWHFGDGQILTETQSTNPNHIYPASGEYEAYLIITTDEGCIDTSFTHIIEVGEPISPTFAFGITTICQGEPVQVTNTSIDAGRIDAYSFSGDGFTLDNCPNQDEPTLIFDDVSGLQTVTLYVEYNGCMDTTTQEITVLGPIGKLNYECNCDTPLDYVFTANTSDAEYWTWDFGDGTIIENSTDAVMNHSYTQSGDYHTVLTSYADATGCQTYVDSAVVKVRQLNANLEVQSLSCFGESLEMNASSSTDVFASSCSRSYLWYFGDDSRPIKTSSSFTNHTYPQNGDYTAQLFVEDINGCVDSTTALVRVFDINAAYTADTLIGCPPFEINFSDLTQADTTIVSWNWNFDDGNTSSDANPTNLFENIEYNNSNAPIPFTVSLEVIDALGCNSSINNLVITPLGSNPDFETSSPATICAGDSVSFIPTGSNINTHTFFWEYGNDSTSSGPNGNGVFSESGIYDITLTVTDQYNCSRSFTQSLVNVQSSPTAIINPSYGEDEALCYPVIVSFTDASITDDFGSRSWDLNMGGPTLDMQTVQTTYLQPGFYNIDLEVETSFGCVSDTSLIVNVQGPLAEIDLNPEMICLGGSIELGLLDTADLATWQFDFGDGNVATSLSPSIHDYDPTFNPTTGQTLITLVMYSEDSVCSSARTTNVFFEQLSADFARNNEMAAIDSMHCFGISDIFTNTSSLNSNAFQWTFSNGQTFTSEMPPAQILDPGEHLIKLQVITELGCRNSIEKYMYIFPLPIAEASDGIVCRGDEVLLTATGGVIYDWQPANTIDDPTSDIVFANPLNTSQYTVFVTDTNSCTSSAQSNVVVIQPTPSMSGDTIIRIGESHFTGFNLGPDYNYLWTPNTGLECDTCHSTLFNPLYNITYTLTISDSLGCFFTESYFSFEVERIVVVDVPDAFTPNGDGINDVVHVNGLGIEDLLSFTIYNRWGEQVFQTNNIDEGWDGTYKGKIQSPDSYAYIVVVKNYVDEEPITIKGFVDLLK